MHAGTIDSTSAASRVLAVLYEHRNRAPVANIQLAHIAEVVAVGTRVSEVRQRLLGRRWRGHYWRVDCTRIAHYDRHLGRDVVGFAYRLVQRRHP
jgi:hypothetical protein